MISEANLITTVLGISGVGMWSITINVSVDVASLSSCFLVHNNVFTLTALGLAL